MADLWNLGEGHVPHCGNWQVRGVPNADQQAAQARGVFVESMWYGPMQQEPYRSSSGESDMLSVMERWKAYLPEMTAMRLPFNINNWGTYGSSFHGDNMRTSTHEFLAAARNRDVKIHWCLMDGPSQRDGVELPRPATGSAVSAWLAWADRLNARQVLSHQKLLAWYARNPDDAPEPWAFEFINEPDSYAGLGRALGDMNRAYAIYAQHNVEIYRQVYGQTGAPFPNAWLFVGGFNYSANFDVLVKPNPHLPGGVSPVQYIRNNIPAARLCWSIHAYPGWIGGPTRASVRQAFRRRLGGVSPKGLEGDRIQITETNCRHDVVFNYPFVQDALSQYNLMQNAQWFAEMGIGIGWWTGANYAQARLLQIQGGPSGVRMDEGWSHANFHYLASFRNNPLYFTGQQNGERPLAVELSLQRWDSTDTGTDEMEELRAAGLTDSTGAVVGIRTLVRGYGGRGTCVLRGKAQSANLLYGGDGWNVLYGGPSPSIDFLALGRGGGVARSTHSVRTILYGSTHTPSRLYLSPGKNWVMLFDNTVNHHTIVVDPSSRFTNVITGFNPDRDGRGNGDRISFRGAFATIEALREALTIELAPHGDDLAARTFAEDLVVRLPGGGTVRFPGKYALMHTIAASCLDLTDNWYGANWTEPLDYDPAALNQPAPETVQFEPLLFMTEAGGPSEDEAIEGSSIARDLQGRALAFRALNGAVVPLR